MKPASLISLCVLLAATPALSRDGNHLKREIPIPSEGSGFDYITFGGGKLFIGHRAEGLQALALADPSKPVAIEKTKSSNGATLAPELDLGFSGNGDGTLTVFKLSDLSVVEQIKVGEELDSTRYDPTTKRVAVFGLPGKDKKSSTIAIYQMPERKLTAQIDAASAKLENSVADGAGNIFVAAQDINAVLRIDLKSPAVTAKFPLPCKQPTGLDYDKEGKRLFVGCRGEFSEPMFLVVKADTGETIFKAPTSPGNDGVVYDAARKRIYVTNGIGAHLLVFEQSSPDKYALNEVIGTRPMAKTVALDSVSGDIFTMAAEPFFDTAKKNLSYIAPFYPNGFTKDTFRVLQYGK